MNVFRLIKKNSFSLLILLFIVFLFLYSNATFTATKNGMKLWANTVIPSLFPFLVAVELLNHTNIMYYLSIYLNKFMKPLFNLPGISSYPFIMGILSGYPIGAKIVSDLYATKKCTIEEAERMLSFTNNSGPLFIVGTVGISFYSSSTIGIILLISHISASITVGLVVGFFSRFKKYNSKMNYDYKLSKNEYSSNNYNNINNNNVEYNKAVSIFELGEILRSSIMNSIKTILLIGGFVTLFSVFISIIEKTKFLMIFSNFIGIILNINYEIIKSTLIGLIEFTNGLSLISLIHLKNISINIIISSFIIGLGGFSVLLQVLSIISKYGLSIHKYIIGKILQACFSAIYTFLLLQIPFFNFNL